MKNFLKRLNGRKGFTLVECIVAVAVFAAMTLIVFMILMNARAEAQKANKTEEDLTQLIDNVVGDESFQKYDATSDVLNLNISGGSGGTYKISYSTIDGYKNFVECPTCGHFANNTDFMNNVKRADFSQTSPFTCPADNSHVFYQILVCDDCGNTAAHNSTAKFQYIPESGSFACLSCNSLAVKGDTIDERITSDAKMSISGMVPNAILYGQVDKPATVAGLAAYEKGTGGGNYVATSDGKVQLNLKYNSSTGMYTLSVYPSSLPSDADFDSNDFKVKVLLPPHYDIMDMNEVVSAGTCAYNYGATDDDPTTFTFDFNSQSEYRVEFKLLNSTSGFSFEYDYNSITSTNGQGLAGYWFDLNFGSVQRVDGYVTSYAATGYIGPDA